MSKRNGATKNTPKSESVKPEGMWGNNTGISMGMMPGREVFGPLFFITVAPVFVMLVWYTNYHLEGSFMALGNRILNDGFIATLTKATPSPFTAKAWQIIFTYMGVQLLLMRFIPGKEFIGPTSS